MQVHEQAVRQQSTAQLQQAAASQAKRWPLPTHSCKTPYCASLIPCAMQAAVHQQLYVAQQQTQFAAQAGQQMFLAQSQQLNTLPQAAHALQGQGHSALQVTQQQIQQLTPQQQQQLMQQRQQLMQQQQQQQQPPQSVAVLDPSSTHLQAQSRAPATVVAVPSLYPQQPVAALPSGYSAAGGAGSRVGVSMPSTLMQMQPSLQPSQPPPQISCAPTAKPCCVAR